jgi:hypothetical protein
VGNIKSASRDRYESEVSSRAHKGAYVIDMALAEQDEAAPMMMVPEMSRGPLPSPFSYSSTEGLHGGWWNSTTDAAVLRNTVYLSSSGVEPEVRSTAHDGSKDRYESEVSSRAHKGAYGIDMAIAEEDEAAPMMMVPEMSRGPLPSSFSSTEGLHGGWWNSTTNAAVLRNTVYLSSSGVEPEVISTSHDGSSAAGLLSWSTMPLTGKPAQMKSSLSLPSGITGFMTL